MYSDALLTCLQMMSPKLVLLMLLGCFTESFKAKTYNRWDFLKTQNSFNILGRMLIEPLPTPCSCWKPAYSGFQGASWVYFSRTDSGVHPHLGCLSRLMLTAGLRDNWWRQLKMSADLQICGTSSLAQVANNAVSVFGGFPYNVYQQLRIFWEITFYKSREPKEGENVSLKKAFLWPKYLVTARVNRLCC